MMTKGHVYDMELGRCPFCQGCGLVFYDPTFHTRKQNQCPLCGGTGYLVSARKRISEGLDFDGLSVSDHNAVISAQAAVVAFTLANELDA